MTMKTAKSAKQFVDGMERLSTKLPPINDLKIAEPAKSIQPGLLKVSSLNTL